MTKRVFTTLSLKKPGEYSGEVSYGPTTTTARDGSSIYITKFPGVSQGITVFMGVGEVSGQYFDNTYWGAVTGSWQTNKWRSVQSRGNYQDLVLVPNIGHGHDGWQIGFRPTHVTCTIINPPGTDFHLYAHDSSYNYILNVNPGVSGQQYELDWSAGGDFHRFGLISNDPAGETDYGYLEALEFVGV